MIARARILIVTRNLPPLVGGMERLNWHMAAELAKSADVRIIGPEGAAALAPAGVPVREAPLRPLWKFLLRARALARREARAWKPDLVLAGSGLTAPLAHTAARVCGARTAVYVHGLDVAVKHPAYRAIWLPALRRMDRVIANSRATAALCRGIGIDPDRIGIVHPGVDFPGLQPRFEEGGAPRSGGGVHVGGPEGPTEPQPNPENPAGSQSDPQGLAGSRLPPLLQTDVANRPLLLSVGRLSARKGLREFVTNAMPRIVAEHPDAMLLIVGDAPNQALHAEAQTPASIQAAANAVGLGEHIRFLGTITDYDELGSVYRAADVHVFSVREIPGDPEGFGMVAVEAAAHGLPTVAFATGGVPDAVVEGESGSLVTPGDYAAFAACVNAWLAREDRLDIAVRCAAAAENFSWQHFGDRLRTLLAIADERA